MSTLTLLIIVGAVLLVLTIIAASSQSSHENKAIGDAISTLEDFNSTETVKCDSILEAPHKFYFAVDDNKNQVFFTCQGEKYRFNYEDILSTELMVNDDVVETKKSLGGTIGGSLVGGVVGGGVGAVIGGLSSKGTSRTKVSSVKVHTVLRNRQSFDIVCCGECKKGDDTYNTAISRAQRIMDICKVCVDKADKAREVKKEPESVVTPPKELTQVEELQNLFSLLEKGAITKEEFEALKQDVLKRLNQ